jgi:hypothetical protein
VTLEQKQRKVCDEFAAPFTPAPTFVISAVALGTEGKRPIHGLRHPLTSDTTGWFIWCGDYSPAPDFFKPLHTEHLLDLLPEAASLLGLPPGYRFLTDHGVRDVWFDTSLLSV